MAYSWTETWGALLFSPRINVTITNADIDPISIADVGYHSGDHITIKINSIEYISSVFGQTCDELKGLFIHNSSGAKVITLTSTTLTVGATFNFVVPDIPLSNDSYYQEFTIKGDAHYQESSMLFPAKWESISYTSPHFEIPLEYRPKITITAHYPYIKDYKDLYIAGLSKMRMELTVTHNVQGDNVPITGYVKGDKIGGNFTLISQSGNDYVFESTTVFDASVTDYAGYVTAVFTDSRGRQAVNSVMETVKGYFLPRLIVNTSGENTYVSRCDDQGRADGLGNYGHLHLKWETSLIDNTNTLVSTVVTLNGTTVLTPTSGSIASGYIDYIFPLALQTQGNLSIVLTDHLVSNTITSQVVPKGAMPMSLYDDGADIGVAYGRMATQGGVWMYLPFYLKAENSTKVYHIKVDDSGNLSTELVN